jgi:xanthine dehydrogenase YagS FAD-binding subunit
VNGGKLSQARIVLGAVANVPYQVQAANQFLEGKSVDESTANKAADLILENAHGLSGNAYKIPIARALIHRTLQQLVA